MKEGIWRKEREGKWWGYIYQFNEIRVFFDEIKSAPKKDGKTENARVKERVEGELRL